MKQKEVTKTFMMISNGKKPCGLLDYIKYFSALRVNTYVVEFIGTFFSFI